MEQKTSSGRRYALQISYVLLLTASLPLNLLALASLSTSAVSGGDLYVLPPKVYIALLLVYTLAIFIIGVLNIVKSFKMYSENDYTRCINSMLILKYGLVFFFILNFSVIFVLMAGGSLVAVILILAFFTWLLLIPGGFYGIQVIRFSYAHKKISLPLVILHTLLQFCFLADVPDAMYLSVKKWGVGKRSAVFIGCIYAITFLAAVYIILRVF